MTSQSEVAARALLFGGNRRVELAQCSLPAGPLDSDEVTGRTLYTLVSPGTELNWVFDCPACEGKMAGYAAVMEITAVGSAVAHLHPGSRVFLMGPHCSMQRAKAHDVIALPPGLSPKQAPFARLIGVSWTTLTTTRARPGDRVLVYGLGIIGNLAAQLFAAAGYCVTAIDPNQSRCELARASGLGDVREKLGTDDDADAHTNATLAIDCTGHEQAVLDACNAVGKGGEVVLVGVPWKPRCQATAFQICHAVFHRYITLRSGWEWELPRQPQDFARGSISANLTSALQWLAQGRIRTDHLAQLASPKDAQRVYSQLLDQTWPALTALFNWDNHP